MLTNIKKHRKTFYLGVLIAIIVVGLHACASYFSWYWIFRGFDIPMHIFGGLMAGYFGVWTLVVFFTHRSPKNTPKIMFLTAVVSAFLVGVLWELLEAHYGLSGLDAIHRFDAIKDLINDMIGGIISYYIWKSLLA